jgi:hypothetical protein
MDTPMSDVLLATDPSTGMIIDVPGPFHIPIPQINPDSPGLAGPIHHSPAQIRATQMQTAITTAGPLGSGGRGSGGGYPVGGRGGYPGGGRGGGGGGGGGGGPPGGPPGGIPGGVPGGQPLGGGGNPPGNERLLGAAPEIFNGSRKDLYCFIQSFSLYWEMNADHPAMANPYKCTLICLGLI